MKRRLFTILSALSLVLCVAFGALWVRSYWFSDGLLLAAPLPGVGHCFYVQGGSDDGIVATNFVCEMVLDPKWTLSWESIPASPEIRRWYIGSYPGKSVLFGWGLIVPHWLLVLSAAVLPAAWLIRERKRRQQLKPGHCLKCGYDLRATKDRCPECGTPIPTQPSTSARPLC